MPTLRSRGKQEPHREIRKGRLVTGEHQEKVMLGHRRTCRHRRKESGWALSVLLTGKWGDGGARALGLMRQVS